MLPRLSLNPVTNISSSTSIVMTDSPPWRESNAIRQWILNKFCKQILWRIWNTINVLWRMINILCCFFSQKKTAGEYQSDVSIIAVLTHGNIYVSYLLSLSHEHKLKYEVKWHSKIVMYHNSCSYAFIRGVNRYGIPRWYRIV